MQQPTFTAWRSLRSCRSGNRCRGQQQGEPQQGRRARPGHGAAAADRPAGTRQAGAAFQPGGQQRPGRPGAQRAGIGNALQHALPARTVGIGQPEPEKHHGARGARYPARRLWLRLPRAGQPHLRAAEHRANPDVQDQLPGQSPGRRQRHAGDRQFADHLEPGAEHDRHRHRRRHHADRARRHDGQCGPTRRR